MEIGFHLYSYFINMQTWTPWLPPFLLSTLNSGTAMNSGKFFCGHQNGDSTSEGNYAPKTPGMKAEV